MADNVLVSGSVVITTLAAEMLAAGSQEGSIKTGFALDKWTCGLNPAQLIVIAARPSMGKTAWATSVATHAAIRDRKKVGIVTLETTKEDLLLRLVCAESGISRSRFTSGAVGREERRRADDAISSLRKSGLVIYDKPYTTMRELRAQARRLKLQDNLDLLIVDYLGLIEPPRGDNRAQDVSAITRGLKALAKELGIPIICLAQLDPKCDERVDKRPMLSDLGGSGSIEQDADIVAFIFRQEVYEPYNMEVRNKAEFIVAKHRVGRIGTMAMYFDKDIARFSDLACTNEESRSLRVGGSVPRVATLHSRCRTLCLRR